MTSLVNVIIQESKKLSDSTVRFVKLSATSAGINDVKKVVTEAETLAKEGKRTVVFMDEIHRFNKLQQDIFLPHVEAGTFTLIGATTENPSSSLNSALLSRCRVFVLNKLSKEDLIEILSKAVTSMSGKIVKKSKKQVMEDSNVKFYIEDVIIDWLADICDGDARVALGGLEIAVQTKLSDTTSGSQPIVLNLSDIKDSLKETQCLSDKNDSVNHMYSALHYSILGNDINAALYWLVRILDIKEDPVCIAKRLIRIASEAIGTDDELSLSMAVNTLQACQMIGLPECDVMLAECVIYLAGAEKSEEVAKAYAKSVNTIENQKGPQPKVPLFIKDTSSQGKLKAALGKNYKESISVENLNKCHLPEGLENANFFDSNDDGN
ncbi:ATPase WRNIP1 isoform X2 [Copidosoma floridanum]|uniref:ATPase WRNIP1 isoform X2 n=1 Tax=Copidosoma floridanum TaxID=29053 RepID=UPI0006C96725|nr:ATPase WRNIP1 isoform X2 [Copidosoma floridanum]